jgi:hypothetical protein
MDPIIKRREREREREERGVRIGVLAKGIEGICYINYPPTSCSSKVILQKSAAD